MPVYIRKNVSFTPPSIYNMQLEDDNDYLLDPDQMRDILPQPYRMINKILMGIVEDAWEIVECKEKALLADAQKIRPPLLDQTQSLAIYGNASSLAESVDGKYIFVGLPNGLAVFDAATQFPLHRWEEDHAEITTIKTYLLSPNYHLIVTVDDMAIARLFLFAFDHIFFIKALNENSPEGTSKTLCQKCEASTDGDFLGISFENTTTNEVWLEVHKMPTDSWIKDLDTIQQSLDKQKEGLQQEKTEVTASIIIDGNESEQASVSKLTEDDNKESRMSGETIETRETGDTKETQETRETRETRETKETGDTKDTRETKDTLVPKDSKYEEASQSTVHSVDSIIDKLGPKFGHPSIVFKAKPPAHQCPPANSSSSIASALSKVDQGDVLGTGANHVLSTSHLESREAMFENQHHNLLEYLPKEESEKSIMVTFHFLNPSHMLPSGLDHAHPQNKPVSIMLWWSGTQHVCHYSLFKTAKASDELPTSTPMRGSSSDNTDLEFKPEIVWPCSKTITCSDVSPCGSHIAFGLDNGNLMLWNYQIGLPKAVLTVSGNGGVRSVRFLDPSLFPSDPPHYPPYPVNSATFVLAEYNDGTQALFDTCDGSQQIPRIIASKPEYEEDKQTLIKLIPELPDLVFYVKKDGSMYIKNIGTGAALCEVVLPDTHNIQTPWNPIIALGNEGHTLFLKGEGKHVSEEGEVSDISCLFKFNLREYSILEEYWTRVKETSDLIVFTTCEQRLDNLMKERLQQQAMRKPRMQKHWGQLRGALDIIQNAREVPVESLRLTHKGSIFAAVDPGSNLLQEANS